MKIIDEQLISGVAEEAKKSPRLTFPECLGARDFYSCAPPSGQGRDLCHPEGQGQSDNLR